MRSAIRAAVPLAVAVGLVAAGPAAADAKSPAKAHASGGDVVELTYPTIVQSRVTRTRRALNRATDRIEDGQPVLAAASLKVVRRQLGAAWRGAKYVIRTTPPPPAEEASVRRRARASGDPATGPTYAAPADTGFKVLSLQHRVAGEMVQLIDGAHGTGLNALSTTLYFALNRRDQAIQDILTLAPPAPADDEEAPDEPEDPADPGADAARVVARAAGDPVVTTFDTVMPNVVPQLDDETQAIVGTETDATDLTAGGRRLLNAAEAQIARTKTVVNTNWPPIPAED
jgi:hypothetical protein